MLKAIGAALTIIGIILLLFMTIGSVLPLSIWSKSFYISIVRYIPSNNTSVIVMSSGSLKLTTVEGYKYYLKGTLYLEPRVINVTISDIVDAKLYILKSADAALVDGYVNTLTPENIDKRFGELKNILERKAISKDRLEKKISSYGVIMLNCERILLHYNDISVYAIIIINRKKPFSTTPSTTLHLAVLHGNLDVYAKISPSMNQKIRATIIAVLGILIASSSALIHPEMLSSPKVVKRLTSIRRVEGSKAEDKEERLRGREPSQSQSSP